MAARTVAGSLLKGVRLIQPVVVQDVRLVVGVSVGSSSVIRPSSYQGISSGSSLEFCRRYMSSEKVTDAVIRDAVKRGVVVGLTEAMKKLNSDDIIAVRHSLIKEAVDSGVQNALKDVNISVEPQVMTEEQEFIKMAVKEGVLDAVKEMILPQNPQEPQKSEFRSIVDLAMDDLKLHLDAKIKAALDEVKNSDDTKFVDAVAMFINKLNVFMDLHKEMFTVDQEASDGGDADKTKEGDGGEDDKTKASKVSRSKFDVFMDKYNEDTLENVRVLGELLNSTEEVKRHQKKDKDFIADWCKTTADGFVGKERMDKFRKAMSAFPYLGKGYFYYVVLRMMAESGIPMWHFPMVIRAARLLMAQKALKLYNESRKKPGEKPDDKQDDDPKQE